MYTSRRAFLQAVSKLTLVSPFAGSALLRAAPPSSRRPNILFIFSDDHACQAIGAYGSIINRTPNIDRIASEGALFANSFCTNSICAPSRAVVLTGRFSHLNGVRTNGHRFDGSQATYPKLLQAAGYQTAMIGKWHLKSDPTGFAHWQVLPGQGSYYNPDFKTPDGQKRYEGYVTDVITDLAIDWLSTKRAPDRPFLLHCWHKAPHRRWLPGPKHLRTLDGVSIPEPPTLFDDYSGRSSSAGRHKMGIGRHMSLGSDLKVTDPLSGNEKAGGPFRRLTPEQRKQWDGAYVPNNEAFRARQPEGDDLVRWKYQRYIKDYLRCIASVDDSVGRLLSWLDDADLADNTIVVYSSDQGFYLGEHGWFDKRWMYEESLRMPLLLRWPGVVAAGTRVSAMVQNIDYAPTFLEAAGVAPPAEMQGMSLAPLFRGERPADWRTSIYYHYFEHGGHGVPRHYGVRTERYKLIRFYASDEWELFDLAKDPMELRSVHGDPGYKSVAAELKAELERLRDEYDDHDGEPYQHPAFPASFGLARVERTADGWAIHAGEDCAYALREAEKTFRVRVTLRTKLKTLRTDGIRNGMVAFGIGPRPEDVIRCGVYIGVGQYVILENGNQHLAAQAKPFDKSKTFDVCVTVDLRAKTISMEVDGDPLTAPLERDWDGIRTIGYGLNQTATSFTELSVTGE